MTEVDIFCPTCKERVEKIASNQVEVLYANLMEERQARLQKERQRFQVEKVLELKTLARTQRWLKIFVVAVFISFFLWMVGVPFVALLVGKKIITPGWFGWGLIVLVASFLALMAYYQYHSEKEEKFFKEWKALQSPNS